MIPSNCHKSDFSSGSISVKDTDKVARGDSSDNRGNKGGKKKISFDLPDING